jgi:hypothetical protein
MKNDNPYLPPVQPAKPITAYLRDLPKEERRRLILEGKTTAGPLAVLVNKYPIMSAVIAVITLGAFWYGCWTCIQM